MRPSLGLFVTAAALAVGLPARAQSPAADRVSEVEGEIRELRSATHSLGLRVNALERYQLFAQVSTFTLFGFVVWLSRTRTRPDTVSEAPPGQARRDRAAWRYGLAGGLTGAAAGGVIGWAAGEPGGTAARATIGLVVGLVLGLIAFGVADALRGER